MEGSAERRLALRGGGGGPVRLRGPDRRSSTSWAAASRWASSRSRPRSGGDRADAARPRLPEAHRPERRLDLAPRRRAHRRPGRDRRSGSATPSSSAARRRGCGPCATTRTSSCSATTPRSATGAARRSRRSPWSWPCSRRSSGGCPLAVSVIAGGPADGADRLPLARPGAPRSRLADPVPAHRDHPPRDRARPAGRRRATWRRPSSACRSTWASRASWRRSTCSRRCSRTTSNNAATAVILAPVAAQAAAAGGIDLTKAFLAVAYGTSCAFLLPFAHQCNLMVMGPGAYETRDFARVGLGMSLVVAAGHDRPAVPVLGLGRSPRTAGRLASVYLQASRMLRPLGRAHGGAQGCRYSRLPECTPATLIPSGALAMLRTSTLLLPCVIASPSPRAAAAAARPVDGRRPVIASVEPASGGVAGGTPLVVRGTSLANPAGRRVPGPDRRAARRRGQGRERHAGRVHDPARHAGRGRRRDRHGRRRRPGARRLHVLPPADRDLHHAERGHPRRRRARDGHGDGLHRQRPRRHGLPHRAQGAREPRRGRRHDPHRPHADVVDRDVQGRDGREPQRPGHALRRVHVRRPGPPDLLGDAQPRAPARAARSCTITGEYFTDRRRRAVRPLRQRRGEPRDPRRRPDAHLRLPPGLRARASST